MDIRCGFLMIKRYTLKTQIITCLVFGPLVLVLCYFSFKIRFDFAVKQLIILLNDLFAPIFKVLVVIDFFCNLIDNLFYFVFRLLNFIFH